MHPTIFLDNTISDIYNYCDFMKRLFNLIYILLSQFTIHYSKNLFNICLHKPKLERLELIKNIAIQLEKNNIVYVKIFQSLSIDSKLLYNNEIEFLTKYLDNVPYSNYDIDFDLLKTINENYDEYNIKIESISPINSGIISIVFDATYNSKKVVIKMLKKDINVKLNNMFQELETLIKFIKYIPVIKELNLDRIIASNKDLLLNQTNFISEYNNIMTFKNKLSNNPEYVIPFVYNITLDYPNILIMENIKGLTYNEVINYCPEIKNTFGKILYKLGIIGNLFHGAVHCDLHAGNIFFYINDDSNNVNETKKPKYQIGLIDFGIVTYPSKEKQDIYYKFFFEMQLNKNYENIDYVVKGIIEENELYKTMEDNKKNILHNDVINVIKKYTSQDIDINFFYQLSKCLNSYNLYFNNEFNNLCLSLQMVQSLGMNLCKSTVDTQNEILSELAQINDLLIIK
tara:strand:- start:284 stop:1654 length:1371 start_codon:yes stop_codon:yes gene_type:complete